MKPELKKLLILNAPYLLFVYLFDKIGQAVRLAPGADLSGKVLSLADGFSAAFATPLPSLAPMDLLIGIVGAVLIRLMVYFKGKNAKKYRKGIEYGSARWGNAEDIKPYTDPVFQNNVLLTQTERLALQFLTQMQTTKSRYLTLSILGARREQIKRSINQQVLWYFLLPLILACISGAVGIYAMQLYLYSGAAHLEQSYPLLIAMAVIVVLVMVIYGVAVARTANREIGKLNYKPNS